MCKILDKKMQLIECERYTYTTKNGLYFLFQRMNKDKMWYVIFNNQIINYGQYRHDLEEWCDDLINFDVNNVNELLKQREVIEAKIRQLDEMALINYEINKLQ